MNYTYEPAEKSRVKLLIALDKEDWEQAIKKAYEKNKSKYHVQGFRKGHVPFQVIVCQYGVGYFYEDAINLSIQEYYPEIMSKEAEHIDAIGEPYFSIEDLSDNGVKISAMIPVKPEVKIAAYTGIKVEKVEYNVSDAEVEADVERLLDRNASEDKVTDRPCRVGDIIVMDFSGSVNGKKFEGGTAENYRYELGSHNFIPGFEEQLYGMNCGEEKDINVTFPENYTEELKGKDAVFAVKLHEIIQKTKPELTDEFIKDKTGEQSVAEYKEKVRKNLQAENDKRAANENEDKLLSAIKEQTQVELPDVLVESEIDNLIKQLEYRLMYQGLKFADYLKVTSQTEEQIRESYKEIATDRVIKKLIVDAIIEKEKIVATDEEVDAKIKEQAESVSKSFEEYKANMESAQVEYIKNSIVVDKLFAFLTANNEFIVAEDKKTEN